MISDFRANVLLMVLMLFGILGTIGGFIIKIFYFEQFRALDERIWLSIGLDAGVMRMVIGVSYLLGFVVVAIWQRHKKRLQKRRVF